MNNKAWLAPLTGVLFVVALIAAIMIQGEPPDPTKDSAQEVVDFYKDNDSATQWSAALLSLAAVFFVFWGGWLRGVLRGAPGSTDVLSTVAFGGAVLFAAGVTVSAAISFTMGDLADDVSEEVINTLNALSWDFFFPMAAGICILLLASGISIVRHGPFPSWLGWVAILIGVVCLTPAGFFGIMAAAIWLLVVSVLGIRAARAVPAA